jgi:hypothetical protein
MTGDVMQLLLIQLLLLLETSYISVHKASPAMYQVGVVLKVWPMKRMGSWWPFAIMLVSLLPLLQNFVL